MTAPSGWRTTLRAYLELSRLSNVPTVASDSLAGAALATVAWKGLFALEPKHVASSAAACCALYVSGMALNDLLDRRIDARERPTRPIPSGRVSAAGAATFASVLLVGGLWLLVDGPIERLAAGIVLAALIVLYNLIHSCTTLSVAVMGACRAMVYVVAALGLGVPRTWWPIVGPAVLVGGYVAAFSVLARREATDASGPPFRCPHCGHGRAEAHGTCTECGESTVPPASTWRREANAWRLLPAIPLAAILFLPPAALAHAPRDPREIATVIALVVVAAFIAAWITTAGRKAAARPPRIGAAVTMWIAALSLIDAYLLILCGAFLFAALAGACFLLTRLAQRRIAGT